MALGANAEEGERSLRDDLAASLKEIEEREAASATPDDDGAEGAQVQADEQSTETEADRGDGRDAHGRFVKKGEEAADTDQQSSEAKPDDAQQATSPDGKDEGQAQQPSEDQPPKSWRADEAAVWKDLPASAKATILRREQEAARLAGANDQERMFGREVAEVFRPHMEVINSFGVTPQHALRGLLDNDRILRFGSPEEKLAKARQLVTDYGIDLNQLAQFAAQPVDPQVAELQREIDAMRAQIAPTQSNNFSPLPPSAEEATILSEIEAFRSDPAHPHFDAVHGTMGRLLEAGAASDLESAYHAAVAMDPALRSTVAYQAPQRPQEDKTAAARRAAASVTASPGATGRATPATLRDELREGLRSAGFSV